MSNQAVVEQIKERVLEELKLVNQKNDQSVKSLTETIMKLKLKVNAVDERVVSFFSELKQKVTMDEVLKINDKLKDCASKAELDSINQMVTTSLHRKLQDQHEEIFEKFKNKFKKYSKTKTVEQQLKELKTEQSETVEILRKQMAKQISDLRKSVSLSDYTGGSMGVSKDNLEEFKAKLEAFVPRDEFQEVLKQMRHFVQETDLFIVKHNVEKVSDELSYLSTKSLRKLSDLEEKVADLKDGLSLKANESEFLSFQNEVMTNFIKGFEVTSLVEKHRSQLELGFKRMAEELMGNFEKAVEKEKKQILDAQVFSSINKYFSEREDGPLTSLQGKIKELEREVDKKANKADIFVMNDVKADKNYSKAIEKKADALFTHMIYFMILSMNGLVFIYEGYPKVTSAQAEKHKNMIYQGMAIFHYIYDQYKRNEEVPAQLVHDFQCSLSTKGVTSFLEFSQKFTQTYFKSQDQLNVTKNISAVHRDLGNPYNETGANKRRGRSTDLKSNGSFASSNGSGNQSVLLNQKGKEFRVKNIGNSPPMDYANVRNIVKTSES